MNALENATVPCSSLDWARVYLDRRWQPIPVPRGSKIPSLKDWTNARFGYGDLEKEFSISSNVSLLNGLGDLVDVDLDCPEALAAAPYFLPKTEMIGGREGSARSHWFYRVAGWPSKRAEEFRDPTQEKKKDGTTGWVKGQPQHGGLLLEVLGRGSATLVAPSVVEGRRYAWDALGEPAEVALLEFQKAVGKVAAASLIARHWRAGARHAPALALAGALANSGWPQQDVEKFIEAVCRGARDDDEKDRLAAVKTTFERKRQDEHNFGWPELAKLLPTAVVDTARRWLGLNSGDSGNTGNHSQQSWPAPIPLGAVPAAPPFPLETLPESMARFVKEIAWAMNCPDDFAAVPLLALAGGAVGASRQLAVTGSHEQSTCLYAVVVSPPGTAKSPVLKMLRRPFDAADERYRNEWKREMEEWDEAEGDDKGPKPTLRRCVVSDTTTESLAMTLYDNPRGVVMVRDELMSLVAGMNQYKGGKGNDRQVYIQLWAGDTILIDRKSDKSREGAPLCVRDPFTAIIGCIQPLVLAHMRGDRGRGAPGPDDGFLDRFLFSYPVEMPAVGELFREVTRESRNRWQEVVEYFLSLEMACEEQEGDEEKSLRPIRIRFTQCGRDAWKRFTDVHAAEINAKDFPKYLVGPWSKLKGYGARLALTLHLLRLACDEKTGDSVDGGSMDRAARLIEYFKGQARRVYAIVDMDPHTGNARRIVRWIMDKKLDRFTKRDLFQGLKGTFRTVEELDAVLAVVEKHGFIRQEQSPGYSGPGRRPSPIFEVNPNLREDDSHNSHNPLNSDPILVSEDCGDIGKHFETGGSTAEGGNAADFKQVLEAVDAAPNFNGEAEPIFELGVEESVDRSNAVEASECAVVAGVGRVYRLIVDAAGVRAVAAAIEDSAIVYLDIETTGLDPRRDRMRLLSLLAGKEIFLIDCFETNPEILWPTLAGRTIVGHNLAFDLSFLRQRGFVAGNARDTMLLARLLTAGTRTSCSLADLAEGELGISLDKTEQKLDWSGVLTDSKLRYAAADVEVLPGLLSVLEKKIVEAKLEQVADIENRCLHGTVWLAASGVNVNRQRWTALAGEAGAEADALAQRMNEMAPACDGVLEGFGGWNWSSPSEVVRAFAAAGVKLDATGDEQLAALNHPLADLLRKHRAAAKRADAYGIEWLKHVHGDGRVYANWNQRGAESGRMACSKPNLQQLPRDLRYRNCFAAPRGRLLVKADYSQIELRIAAKVANESKMMEAYLRGEDLHKQTARLVLGKTEVSKEDRQLAKAVNFGLLYGMGSKSFRKYALTNYGVKLTEREAAEYRNRFFEAYPALRAWHRRVQTRQPKETRTLAGRRVLFPQPRFTEVLNAPVQGTGADGLKLALAMLWERRQEHPGAFPVLVVHDEIVLEAPAEDGAAVADWLKKTMIEAMTPMIDPVPVEVEVSTASTWGGDPA